jgi:hypothetical protein
MYKNKPQTNVTAQTTKARQQRARRRLVKQARMQQSDVVMTENQLPRSRKIRRGMPIVFPTGNAPTRNRQRQVITEDEYIGEVSGSTGFATTAYPFNPGQSSTFPWGYKIAGLYEKYRVRFLQFYFAPEVSQYATNGQSGKVMLSFDYDASDPAPASKQQVLDTDPHTDGMPYERIRLILDSKQLNGQDSKYVRPGGLPGGADIKTYDGGILYVSTYGNANTNVLGELHVKYEIELEVPVLDNVASAPVNYRVAQFVSTSPEAAAASGTYKVLALATSNANGIGAVNNAGVITLPAGNFLVTVDFMCSNNSAAGVSFQGQFLVNGSVVGVTPVSNSAFSNESAAGTYFVVSNGSTTIAFEIGQTYSSGTSTNTGFMTIVSV